MDDVNQFIRLQLNQNPESEPLLAELPNFLHPVLFQFGDGFAREDVEAFRRELAEFVAAGRRATARYGRLALAAVILRDARNDRLAVRHNNRDQHFRARLRAEACVVLLHARLAEDYRRRRRRKKQRR